MDLVAGIRKEGSRGGRGEFKWADVQSSHHRENYLGHSLMAPVGRWQRGRDLQWYAKKDSDGNANESALSEEEEEIRRLKQAENEALSQALGYQMLPTPMEITRTVLEAYESPRVSSQRRKDRGSEPHRLHHGQHEEDRDYQEEGRRPRMSESSNTTSRRSRDKKVSRNYYQRSRSRSRSPGRLRQRKSYYQSRHHSRSRSPGTKHDTFVKINDRRVSSESTYRRRRSPMSRDLQRTQAKARHRSLSR